MHLERIVRYCCLSGRSCSLLGKSTHSGHSYAESRGISQSENPDKSIRGCFSEAGVFSPSNFEKKPSNGALSAPPGGRRIGLTRRQTGRAFELPDEITRAQMHLPREGIDSQIPITCDRDFFDERWYPTPRQELAVTSVSDPATDSRAGTSAAALNRERWDRHAIDQGREWAHPESPMLPDETREPFPRLSRN